MASLKDLIVSGPARVLGPIYANNFITINGTDLQYVKGNGQLGTFINISATPSDSQTLGYFAGSITIDGGTPVKFIVNPARPYLGGSGGSSEYAKETQGVVRPLYELNRTAAGISIDHQFLNQGISITTAPEALRIPVEFTIPRDSILLPITCVYHQTSFNTYESIPCLVVPNTLFDYISEFGAIYQSLQNLPTS